MPRLLAIGDIHGCRFALDTLLALVRPSMEDEMITLGDYIDRGPNSRGVIERLIALRNETRLITLRGNHELMMQEVRANPGETTLQWMLNGGDRTLDSYEAGTLDDIPDEHWDFIKELRPHHETERFIFGHANLDPILPLSAQPSWLLFWEHLTREVIHISGKTFICGHTPQRSGVPLEFPRTVCIDTGACRGGWLTCLDVLSGRYWQANERGETGEGWLETMDRRMRNDE